jgi:hypothetical protein
MINFRKIVQKQIPPFVGVDPAGPGLGEPPQIKFYWANPPREAAFVCWPPLNSQPKYPHLVEWTPQALGWGSPPQIKFYWANPPRGATFVCWPPQNYQRKYPYLVEWTLQARGWGEPPINKTLPGKPTPRSNFCLLAPSKFSMEIPPFGEMSPAGPRFGVSPPKIKFYMANPPRGATVVCWPPLNSQRIHPLLVEWTLRAPGLGEPPKNKILHGKPTLKSNFCLLAPGKFLTLQGISDGVRMGGTPGGQHFGSPPGSVPSLGEMRSPCQILG